MRRLKQSHALRTGLLLIALAGLAACSRSSPPPDDSGRDIVQASSSNDALIDTLLAKLRSAAEAGDAQAHAATYDERGAIMPPNEPPTVGRAAIQRWAQDFFSKWALQIDTFVVDERRVTPANALCRLLRVTGPPLWRDYA